ncbi:hypothetical protein FACS189428_5970 [Clostridia bacterium]|nr:hypothetical protein FACS189428_5970 [Clostridia bacterium]
MAPVVQAQELPFQNGEELDYTIRYKYGVVVMKAATARYRLNTTTYRQQQALKSSLDFKTNSFFDKVLTIRDTLAAYASMPNLTPLYHTRSVNEGSSHYTEEMWIRKHGNSFTEISVKRMKKGEVRIDTTMSVKNPGYDFLNIFLYVRNMDYSKWNTGDTRNITAFMGDRKVNIIIRYAGQAILEKGDNLKYNTFRLTIDITDEVFSEAKNAMEVWISNDGNHIPLKLKAKLKIGAAEAEIASYKNLKFPLTSEIRLNGNNTR